MSSDQVGLIPMIRTSSALLNFDRLDQSLSNCKMGQSCVRETGPGTNLITPGYPLYLISCMPELGLSLLIECINIGCGAGCCVWPKNENYFSNCLFRISLMDKWSFWKGIEFMHGGWMVN